MNTIIPIIPVNDLIRKQDAEGLYYWVKKTDKEKEEELNKDIVTEIPTEIETAIKEMEKEE